VSADQVVLATHMPFADRGLFFARTHPERSYSIAARVEGEGPPGMHINIGSPTRSIRRHRQDGTTWVLVGGEGHKVGQDPDTPARYRALEAFAAEVFGATEVSHRWSTQDPVSVDRVPFVGPLAPGSRSLWVATGFSKWGIAAGVAAALMLSDRLQGRDNPWLPTFSSTRVKLGQAPSLVKENLDVGVRFVRDHLARPERRSARELRPGEGAIVRRGSEKLGVHRDEEGRLHAVSPVCTHLWCQVAWNPAERSWDCPCHGSRFGPDGRVIEGPAVRPLERRDPPPG
jgi:nitrite reductase/ring-hydroxylating ferredoxin subunit